MGTALVLGGGDTLLDDLNRVAALDLQYEATVACNDAIAIPPVLLAAVTLHPEKYHLWLGTRRSNGFPEPAFLFTHKVTKRFHEPSVRLTDYDFPGQEASMTSAVMAAKVAMLDLGFDKVVFCGVPMTKTPHYFGGDIWDIADHYMKRWRSIAPEYQARMRSLSGRTRDLLGEPTREWTRETTAGSNKQRGLGKRA